MDLLVVFLYLIVVFVLAFISRRGANAQTDEEIVYEQYLAGRSLNFFESLGSIIATEVSALTFLGIPAFAYSKDFSFLQIYIGAIFGRIVIARLFLPLIYGKGLTIYGIMSKNSTSSDGRRETALIYSVSKVLAVGVRLYSGSILVSEFFNINIYWALLLISALTFLYTMIGGLKAVVRTDLLQASLFIFGGLVAHYLIPEIDGRSWSEMISTAAGAGKINLLDFSNPWPFVVGVIGGILFDMATHGVDQDFIQRLMACRNIKTAQMSIFLSSFVSIFVGSLFLGVGALLWSYYQTHTLPLGVKPDHLFAHFITESFPVGIKGLMLAGVLAATMSTLDSTLNALSSCLWNDLWPNRDIHKINKFLKIDNFIMGSLLLLVAVISSRSDGLLVLGLKVASWSGGALVAIFFSQLVWPHFTKSPFTTVSIIGAYLFNLSAIALNTFIIKGAWQWNVYYGFAAATFFLWLYGKRIVRARSSLKFF